MRNVLLLVGSLAALALVVWVAWSRDGANDDRSRAPALPSPRIAPGNPPETAAPSDDSTGTTLDAEPRAATGPAPVGRMEDPPPPPRGPDVPFVGDVYLANDDGTTRPGGAGHFELWMLAGGEVSTVRVPVTANTFVTTVPERSTLRVLGGELGGQRVRFERPEGPFSPNPRRHALVGVPVPEIALRVVTAGTGADLTDLTVRFADGPGGGRLAGSAGVERRREIIASAVDSPVVLPWLDVRHPVWLEVEAPGHAPARVLVDPALSAERTLQMHPAAGTLTLVVRGPGRGGVDGFVVHRLLEDGGRPVAAHVTLPPATGAVDDPRVFELEGLGSGEHLVRLTLRDVQRLTSDDVAQERVTLEPGLARRLELYVPAP